MIKILYLFLGINRSNWCALPMQLRGRWGGSFMRRATFSRLAHSVEVTMDGGTLRTTAEQEQIIKDVLARHGAHG
jgi:hypothetical protein